MNDIDISTENTFQVFFMDLAIAGSQVKIEPITWHNDTVIRVLPDGTKQQPQHKAVIIVNSQFVAFL